MNPSRLLLLTSDEAFEATALAGAALAGCELIVGREPHDAAILFARHLDELDGVVIDLDHCEHGSAWLGALGALGGRIPALAVTRLAPLHLEPLARRHGAGHWLSKPDNPADLVLALQTLVPPKFMPKHPGA